jgi:hypothetical protein
MGLLNLTGGAVEQRNPFLLTCIIYVSQIKTQALRLYVPIQLYQSAITIVIRRDAMLASFYWGMVLCVY